MINPKTDLTFFTNDHRGTLLDRFKATLADTQKFDMIVGYFRASGFYQLCDRIEKIEKTRILVGLSTDSEAYQAIHVANRQGELDFQSHVGTRELFIENQINEIKNSREPDEEAEFGIRKFIDILQKECGKPGNGKQLEIRAFPSRNIHAKVYIGRYKPQDRDFGFVITGSSNFSYSGLIANHEFNVELKNRGDVEFALKQFEELWRQSVDISEEFADAIQKRTWLNDSITPYELYLKLIYEYMYEDIDVDKDMRVYLPEGFMALEYQKQAVQQALRKIKEHNGVFLADVVGLGKTFITAQLLQQVKGRILVICPPVLRQYWQEGLHSFAVPALVESLGKLERVLQDGVDSFDYIVVDESHRFRNESTQAYDNLFNICLGKQVILVTATPLNNTIDDIFTQLKLFQAPKDSTIPGVPNLEKFFAKLRKHFKGLDRGDPEYKEALGKVSREIREKVLKHVMVRRTRTDVMTYFREDSENQGLFFPDVLDPRRIIYQYKGELESVVNETICLLHGFRYARYIPLLYYSGNRRFSEFERQQQRNVGGFMKSILIKRLESSFFAFRRSVERFITSYERFIAMFDTGTVYISKDTDIYELLDNDDFETLEKLIEENKAHRYRSEDFREEFHNDLKHDLNVLRSIKEQWKDVREDPKLEACIQQLREDPNLKGRLVVFTESKETGDYIFDRFNQEFPGTVMFFSSDGGRAGVNRVTHNPNLARERIQRCFDPNSSAHSDILRILISTDALSEGINLQRANVLINYDLPWNPTRVLQRAGRINRLGTEHPEVTIYNFFPTSQSDEHLGLEKNITNKMQMFHNILGEDAKYLSDGEEIGTQELFDTLNRRSTYIGEDNEGDSELKYLEMIRKVRDEQPELFEKIKQLSRKARSGQRVDGIESDQLITFFRVGALKKFYLNESERSREITFFEAVEMLSCDPDTARQRIPSNYHHLLKANKQRFIQDIEQEMEPFTGGGQSNVGYIKKRLKEREFRQFRTFTEADKDFIGAVKGIIDKGLMPKKTARDIKRELEKTHHPLEAVTILRRHMPDGGIVDRQSNPSKSGKREIVLSGYRAAQ